MEQIMPAGRPSDFSTELADEFCSRIAQGRSVSSVCADLDMPVQDTIYRWKREKPEFSEKLTHAREDRLEAYGDRMLALGSRVIEEMALDPQRVNVAVNAIEKAAKLQAPKRVEISGPAGAPVPIADMTDVEKARRLAFALARANAQS
jgi:transposase-like protein